MRARASAAVVGVAVGAAAGFVLLGLGSRLAMRLIAVWTDPRVLGTIVLWLTFALLLFLRHGYHLRGRQVAVLTIVAFVLLLGCITLSHPAGQGVPR